MSATDAATQSGFSPTGHGPRIVPGRLLRLELRRNAMLWMAPILAVVFYLDTYRSATALPALWGLRVATAIQPDSLVDFAPFVAGAAAWMGSREGRRGTTELVAATARTRWSPLGPRWPATTSWAMASYLICVGVVYGVTASQATWGGPLWWPVAVGAVAVAAVCALAFAAGAFLPSRFTAPLAAAIALLAVEAPNKIQVSPSPFKVQVASNALLFPTSHPPVSLDAGAFFRYLPDLQILQVIFLVALLVGALGALGLPATAGGRWSRRAAALLTVAGLAGAGTAFGLAGTARLTTHGVNIPALHSTADDHPIPYTPVCSHTATIPVCLHRAFRIYLPQMTAALAPLRREVAGLPGAPVRAEQVADSRFASVASVCSGTAILGGGIGGGSLSGSPPVFRFFIAQPPGAYGLSAGSFASEVQLTFVQTLTGSCGSNPAQRAIQAALLKAAGLSIAPVAHAPAGSGHGLPTPAYAAAMRFASLPAATRRAWLQTHLAALRAGRLTIARLP
jgi:hypothetical protein